MLRLGLKPLPSAFYSYSSREIFIEAKRDDLDYGFTQLIAELIALDLWERSPSSQAVVYTPSLFGGGCAQQMMRQFPVEE